MRVHLKLERMVLVRGLLRQKASQCLSQTAFRRGILLHLFNLSSIAIHLGGRTHAQRASHQKEGLGA